MSVNKNGTRRLDYSVVDWRKKIGALILRPARTLGLPVAYLPGRAEHDLAPALPGVSKTDERDAEVIALAAPGVPSAARGSRPPGRTRFGPGLRPVQALVLRADREGGGRHSR